MLTLQLTTCYELLRSTTKVANYSILCERKLRRSHFSQIISYVENQEDDEVSYTLHAKGIMVYPRTNVVIESADYRRGTHEYRFCTLDLAQEWKLIDERLRQIIRFRENTE